VKAFDKQGACFEYIGHVFPGISKEKLKAGILGLRRISWKG